MPGISMKYINILIRYSNTEPSPKCVTVSHHLRTACRHVLPQGYKTPFTVSAY